MTGVLTRRGNADAQGQRHVTAEAETATLNAWNFQELAEAGSILPQGFRGSTALPVL